MVVTCGDLQDFTGIRKKGIEKDLGSYFDSWDMINQFLGWWFTWERGRFLSTNIRERLDQGVERSNHAISDHCPILLNAIGKQRIEHANGIKRFRFEAKWCLENSFEEISSDMNVELLKQFSEDEIGAAVKEIAPLKAFGVREDSNPEKYLGQPMMVGRKKNWAFANFVDRFRKRINDWNVQYHSVGDILSIKVGSYPSFTWRSICGARDLIVEGIIWRIGNGTRVNILNDPWLPGLENSINTWNKELIGSLVDKNQFKRILAIPINSNELEDMVVWKHEATGEFSVKSGYQVLLTELNQNINYNPPNAKNYIDFYKALWTIQIPPKLLMFSALFARKSRRTRIICFGRVESYDSCGVTFKSRWLMLGVPQISKVMTITGKLYLSLYRLYGTVETILARDYKCEIVRASTYAVENVVDAFMPKARACEKAIFFFAVDMGFRRVILEWDSLTVIKKLKTSVEDKSILRSIIHNIRFIEKNFERVSYLFIPREFNKAVHTLAFGRKEKARFGHLDRWGS
ncbi:hypothetical protein J1N35_029898 [Gossypium stocksii]|uniref:RNase H type-1 domain-containing protein n=1 Tax=Gossypium stocksii TaxID=47602 RepID=A0A9D3ZSH1_9ROSI|nr:hypothetical protein J1N35_029898 [Gossypium stocksii]